MNQTLSSLSVAQLRRAIAIREKIEALEKELASIQGLSPAPVPAPSKKAAKKRTMSPEARAKIAASQKAVWAKRKGKKTTSAKPAPKAPAKPVSQPKRKLSAAGRKRLSALAKARWAAAHAAGKTSL
ncbi:MAG TPA: hypothetical protein PKM43_08155 [Verrucomicrobiota bacterium]|nr:hypothetical protein [Verrucomicrobiota bacterium]HRZ34895.1 hypothetical protein [Candidatus Paceibacterota bacterium]